MSGIYEHFRKRFTMKKMEILKMSENIMFKRLNNKKGKIGIFKN